MKEKKYKYGGVKVTVKSPVTPSRNNLENLYNVCNKLYKDEENFYKLGECKRRNMKAV